MGSQDLPPQIGVYLHLGLTPVPLRPRSKGTLVRRGNGWNPTIEQAGRWFANPEVNVGVRCGGGALPNNLPTGGWQGRGLPPFLERQGEIVQVLEGTKPLSTRFSKLDLHRLIVDASGAAPQPMRDATDSMRHLAPGDARYPHHDLSGAFLRICKAVS
ncbi:MAG: hypothetical protein ACE5JL_08425 [Dehalococcoidia bacterium]